MRRVGDFSFSPVRNCVGVMLAGKFNLSNHSNNNNSTGLFLSLVLYQICPFVPI
jgi:hypothetical protein